MRVIGDGGADPVTPQEFMAAVHIDPPVDMVALEILVSAACDVVESAARRMMEKRTVQFETPSASFNRWWFPIAPIVKVTDVSIISADGDTTPLESDQWWLARAYDEPQLVLRGDASHRALRVTAEAGLEREGEARRMRQATILLAKEWHDAGIVIEGRVEAPALSFGVTRLIRQVRYARPQEIA